MIRAGSRVVTGNRQVARFYTRQSKAKANKSEASTQEQRAACKKWLDVQEGIEYAGAYEDLGRSAFKEDVERPNFDRLIADCRAGLVNVIVVHYISRFTRADPNESIALVSELFGLGVTIVSVNEGMFRRGNLVELIAIIMRLHAGHEESRNRSIAIRGAKSQARTAGGYLGSTPPFGFRMLPETVGKIVIHTLTVDESEAAVLREVWDTIKKHADTPRVHNVRHPGSLGGICHDLNARGVPTRGARIGKDCRESKWTVSQLKRNLADPRIAGMAADPIYGTKKDGTRSTQVTGYRIRRDPTTGLPEQLCDPIIPAEEWHLLQEWLKGRGRGKGPQRRTYLLSGIGILSCECGRPMGGHRNGDEEGQSDRAAYRCTKPQGVSGGHDGGNTITQRQLDDYIARRIFALVLNAEDDPETLTILRTAAKRWALTQEDPALVARRRTLAAERADAVSAVQELYADLKLGIYDGPIGRANFLEEKQTREARQTAIEADLVALESRVNPELPIIQWATALYLRIFSRLWVDWTRRW
jgi:DNA invertase Pin-like site-specific DNA recombinase